MTRKEKTKFIIKVTISHFVTYMICGMIAMPLFNYLDTLAGSTAMISGDDLMAKAALVPLCQILRGVLFGIVLLLIKDAFIDKKLGWLRLWIIILILSFFNTPAPSPGSIEGFLYLAPATEPLLFQIGGNLEIFVQTLLFSILVTFRRPKKSTQ